MLTDTKKFCFSPPAQREEIREPHRTNSTSRKTHRQTHKSHFAGRAVYVAIAPLYKSNIYAYF